MPKYLFSIFIFLIGCSCDAQNVEALKTFSFLHGYESKYLLLYSDSSFIISDSRAEDTVEGIHGWLRINGQVYMDTDSTLPTKLKENLQFVLLESPSGKELFPIFEKKILFSDSIEAEKSVLNTFINYDWHHGHSISLKSDNTYLVKIWDHMTEPHYEKGKWKAKG